MIQHFTHLLSIFLGLCGKIKLDILNLWKEKFTLIFGQNKTCSQLVAILCGHTSYSISQIPISLGLKIQFEPVCLNPFKPNFIHPFNLRLDSLPPNIQFLLLVLSDSYRFKKSFPYP
jgi:hypothetical protein